MVFPANFRGGRRLYDIAVVFRRRVVLLGNRFGGNTLLVEGRGFLGRRHGDDVRVVPRRRGFSEGDFLHHANLAGGVRLQLDLDGGDGRGFGGFGLLGNEVVVGGGRQGVLLAVEGGFRGEAVLMLGGGVCVPEFLLFLLLRLVLLVVLLFT